MKACTAWFTNPSLISVICACYRFLLDLYLWWHSLMNKTVIPIIQLPLWDLLVGNRSQKCDDKAVVAIPLLSRHAQHLTETMTVWNYPQMSQLIQHSKFPSLHGGSESPKCKKSIVPRGINKISIVQLFSISLRLSVVPTKNFICKTRVVGRLSWECRCSYLK